jgi:hypothetical protein
MPSVEERLAKLENEVEDINKTLWRIFEAIYGNGKPGLLTEFQLLRRSVEEHHQKIEDKTKEKKADWKWLVPTLAAVVAAVAAIWK